MSKTQTLKGFRDFLPEEAIKRQYIINQLQTLFELYGYDPLETPALEYAEVLKGKYGEDADKLLYTFKDRGGRDVGLKYDQTVPTARVAAQYQDLPKPFKRYQIQPVWRAENPQKGRYREFVQCDADIIGGNYPATEDAEILAVFLDAYSTLGFKTVKVIVNSRVILRKLVDLSFGGGINDEQFLSIIRSIDKLDKIGKSGVKEELIKKGFKEISISDLFSLIDEWKNYTYKDLLDTQLDTQLGWSLQMAIENFKLSKEKVEFNPTLARGLDYYTGIIFEAVEPSYLGSLGGGGRYDKLIGQFVGKEMAAVGFAIGFDRTIEVANELGLIPKNKTVTKVLIAVIEDWEKVFPMALTIVTDLRNNGINTELYLNPREKLEKQLKYADQKGIPFVIIIGPDEAKNNQVTLKNLKSKTQETLSLDEAIQKLTS